ncbi:hypothetical protein L211DRAFT_825323 [Terfezia boudieri ATCC MYA-4762]|uniref:Pre-mRNA-splicing factor CWC26 n=1 Tax=Terfezia boudieri ATCC MYA-4762 TaxID=1051890 RepID=A0A3N4LZH5_9PEZI|nr:hypothetical protein L211DRAFT_825323 [Terfezia boudieri ATCC MYA-4762]
MSLADYLAKNYLTADPTHSDKKKKKKRKKDSSVSSGIIIADDDALGWDTTTTTISKDKNGDGEALIVRDGHTSDFRKTKFSNWTTPTPTSANADDHGAAEAAAEEDNGGGATVVTMSSGAHAGLQTGKQVAAALAKKRAADIAAFKSADPAASGKGQETIYRDASGRIVNIAIARAEARRALEEEAAKQAKQKEMRRGEVQILEAEQRRRDLGDARFKDLARYKDDVEMNEELKAKQRWDDPAMAWLRKDGKAGVSSTTGRKLYDGPWMPNRYGIRPGGRWDGVDRGNGFEKKWFEARGKREARKDLEYQWEMDE